MKIVEFDSTERWITLESEVNNAQRTTFDAGWFLYHLSQRPEFISFDRLIEAYVRDAGLDTGRA